MRFHKSYFISLLVIVLSGCSHITNTLPPDISQAQTLEHTLTYKELKSLPKPMGSIPVSVYSFRDQTGQYKPIANVSSFSTAVTQGASAILVQALSETDWFVPVEREGLQNILTERKIIRAALDNSDNESHALPPLKTAKIILEGGIISYDSNTKTGGLGAEYFGIGVSELYREDIISIYMRAVDVRTGVVLTSVATTKTVLSFEMRAGFFRYVSYKRLAEAEGGYSNNEPMHICVKQAIEKALIDLINSGIDKGLWSATPVTQNTNELTHQEKTASPN
ncbi:transporter [Pseudoalteromonas sp. A25]|uniref:CsgG/HfaB family protein n=1 Tax=Pseudoalteromonas sp. A25 TaxID=116092 RepID=UPI00126130E7|nr:CsgG/HfaB family protein [Pseudoalteromonas sp. A25]BBN82364.1 transporter [Pseudoalteromonas sp. A25]